MANGTVKWFNATKGYGFIAPDDGGADVFVHIRQVEQSGISELKDNQKAAAAATAAAAAAAAATTTTNRTTTTTTTTFQSFHSIRSGSPIVS